ncbi:MAG: rhodanese-like domain-containing protein [Nitrospiraceae bacterium]|nr:rhodanese-like domain-containing protein [Nitrospiraceae bacterium]
MTLLTGSTGIGTMSVEEARKWLADKKEGGAVLLDVRQPQEYRSGHLPGATLIPLPELPDRTGELDASKPVLAYCRSGNRSRAAAALLLTEGFQEVYSLDGGITAWNGRVATGDYRQGLSLLKGGETAEELTLLAWSLEEGSRLFYEKIAGLSADNGVKEVFYKIAGAEEKHKEKVLSAYRTVSGKEFSPDSPRGKDYEGVMEGGLRVEEAIAFLQGEGRSLLDMIEISMQVETNALDLYIKMSREIKSGAAGKVFASLIEEEKQHLSRLGRLLEEKTGEDRGAD